MMDRAKYQHNGIIQYPNFSDIVADGQESVDTGYGLYPNTLWPMTLCKKVICTKSFYHLKVPFNTLFHREDDEKNLLIHYFIKPINTKNLGKYSKIVWNGEVRTDGVIVGRYMDSEELLDPENGWLEDDALSIECGIHIFGYEVNSVRYFNDRHPPFNCENMVTFEMREEPYAIGPDLYYPKTLLSFHSSFFRGPQSSFKYDERCFENLEKCLQFAHGVRFNRNKISIKNCLGIVQTSRLYGLWNVGRIVEQMLISMFDFSEFEKPHKLQKFIIIAGENGGLRHFLKHLLTMVETVEKLREILKMLELEKMSSESLKTIAAKIFSMET